MIPILGKLLGGVIKKIIATALLVGLVLWFLLNGGIKDVEVNVGDVVDFVDDVKNTRLELIPSKEVDIEITDEIKSHINRWIVANEFNEYGDPQGTVYLGGTPLFDESTGDTRDRYEYILSHHPELLLLFE
jgi:hypothetical protein